MKQTSKSIYTIMLAVILAASAVGIAADEYFPSFADENTVGLWLFDETNYPYTNITDAGQYEYDLRLLKGGSLVPGKFGRCLKCTPGLDYNVNYSSWKGHISFKHMREVSGRPGSGLWGPTIAPEKLLNALSKTNFTCEFWIMLMSNPIQDIVIIDLGDKYEPGFTVTLKTKALGFVVENTYAGFKAVCPTALNQIWGRTWHHIALSYSTGSDQFEYFIDGKAQPPVPIVRVTKSKVPPSQW
ncbi:MAG: LamG-like jellyroll fold domain-containing protein, partial [Planctomycetota bacterium]